MKRIILAVTGVMISALVSAKGAPMLAPVKSSVAVVNVKGTSLFKLHYKSAKAQNVKVSLLDDSGHSIYHETVQNTSGFIRPYNFKDIGEGKYVIQVEDENGTTLESVNYSTTKIDKWVNLLKMESQADKYILRIASEGRDDVTIRIFDNNSNLLYREKQLVDRGFAQVYNMKGIESFTVEVTDSNGLVRSVKH